MIHFRPKLALFWFDISAWDLDSEEFHNGADWKSSQINPELSSGNPATSWFHYIGLIYRTKQVRLFFDDDSFSEAIYE